MRWRGGGGPVPEPRRGAPAGAPAGAAVTARGLAATVRPRSCAQLFLVFTRLALQGFGGVLPVAHRELVERMRWLTPAEFAELLAAGQVLPGPNIVNLALIAGDRWFGWRGALSAAGGLLLLPTLIVLAAGAAWRHWQHLPWLAGALRGMGAVAAGLVIATALKLARTLKDHPLGHLPALALAALTLALVGGLRWPLAGVVLGLGGASMLLAALALRRREAAR